MAIFGSRLVSKFAVRPKLLPWVGFTIRLASKLVGKYMISSFTKWPCNHKEIPMGIHRDFDQTLEAASDRICYVDVTKQANIVVIADVELQIKDQLTRQQFRVWSLIWAEANEQNVQ